MSTSKYLQTALLKAHRLCAPAMLAYFLVAQQQSVQQYTGNTYSIARMHYLLTYIVYACLQDMCIMLTVDYY